MNKIERMRTITKATAAKIGGTAVTYMRSFTIQISKRSNEYNS
jgi:hypothetical protein